MTSNEQHTARPSVLSASKLLYNVNMSGAPPWDVIEFRVEFSDSFLSIVDRLRLSHVHLDSGPSSFFHSTLLLVISFFPLLLALWTREIGVRAPPATMWCRVRLVRKM